METAMVMELAASEFHPQLQSGFTVEQPTVDPEFGEIDGSQPGNSKAASGERGLVCAVLQDAATCLAEWQRRPLLAAEARVWVESTSREWPFSFENLCEMLGFDVDTMRRRLLQDVPPTNELAEMYRARVVVPASRTTTLAGRARASRNAEIIRRRREGWTFAQIGRVFGLSASHVLAICLRDRRDAAAAETAPALSPSGTESES